MDYHLRKAGEGDDVARLLDIELAAAARFPAELAPASFFSQGVEEAMFLQARRDGGLWLAVAESGEPVGFALFRLEDGEALLEEVDVLPEHGRRGLGRRLIEAVANQASAAGYPYLYLTTFRDVPWNAPFYERLGFRVAAERELPPGILRILMEERGYYHGERVAMRLALGV